MSWKQLRLAIILGMLVMLFVSPYVVSGAFTDADRQKLNQIAEKGLDIWDSIKSVYKTQIKNQIKIENIMGTEYQVGDNATIFLQLLNGTSIPINDASCYIDIYYPNKTIYYPNTLMTYLNSSDGLYYFEIDNLPNILGVYMISAYCIIPSDAYLDDFLDYSKLEIYENITISGGKIKLSSGIIVNESSPISVWHFDENSGSIAYDSCDDNNGTLIDNVSWSSGYFNYSIEFDGSGDYVNVIFNENLNITNKITISAWVYPTVSADQDIVVKAGSYTLKLDKVGGNLFSKGSIFWGVTEYTATSTTPMVLNNWYHILMTFDSSYVYLYQNGTQEGQSTQCAFCKIATNTNNVTIGNIFNGKIDEVAIWSRSLGGTEITAIYNEPIICVPDIEVKYSTGYIQSNPITLTGNLWKEFQADYDLNDGSIDFKVLNSSNEIICNGLGNIVTCANTISPIKLYANFNMASPDNVSPEMDRWWVTWGLIQYEEVRGSGEMHINPSLSTDDLWRRIRNLLLLLHSTKVTNTTCINSNTLREEKFITYEIGDEKKTDELNLSKYQDIHCNWGCSNSACNPDPLWNRIILLAVIIIILCIVAGLLRLGGVF